jgi:hypothetical protein
LEDLSDPLDQKVHHEKSGQTVFINLVLERQVDHGAIEVSIVRLIIDLLGDVFSPINSWWRVAVDRDLFGVRWRWVGLFCRSIDSPDRIYRF